MEMQWLRNSLSYVTGVRKKRRQEILPRGNRKRLEGKGKKSASPGGGEYGFCRKKEQNLLLSR